MAMVTLYWSKTFKNKKIFVLIHLHQFNSKKKKDT